ncbi:MAG: flavin reductase family protein [Candidatus Puniceispirillaceae bacterium]
METVAPVDGKDEQETGQPGPVTAASLRDAMSRFLTGITIVTTRGLDGTPYGLTVNSFNSVSMNPPLVLWSLDLGHDKSELFRRSGGFTVNVMPGDSADLIRKFAASDAERFEDAGWHWGISGQPVLETALASMECRLWAEYPGGDHVIFVGEVVSIHTRDGHPAAYFKGQLSAYQS